MLPCSIPKPPLTITSPCTHPLRYKNSDEDSVIIYKLCSWSSLKVEGWSTASKSTHSHLRLIAGETQIRIAFKRRISTSSILHTRFSVHFGDIIWIVTQSQLRAVSRLVQSLMDSAVKVAQRGREGSEKSSASSSMESIVSAPGELKMSGLAGKGDGYSVLVTCSTPCWCNVNHRYHVNVTYGIIPRLYRVHVFCSLYLDNYMCTISHSNR